MAHEALLFLRGSWTLVVAVSCPLGTHSPRHTSTSICTILFAQESTKAALKARKHFTRVGFLQAGRSLRLAE
jgi:hypothetical protein